MNEKKFYAQGLDYIFESKKKGEYWDEINIDLQKFSDCLEIIYAVRISKSMLRVGGIAKFRRNSKHSLTPGFISISSSTLSTTMERCQDDNYYIFEKNANCYSFIKKAKKKFEISLYVMHSGQINEIDSINETTISWLTAAKNASIESKVYVVGPIKNWDLNNTQNKYKFEYIYYENPDIRGRFQISNKKNFCANICETNYIAICHSRIVFDSEMLKNITDEFDAITPVVTYKNKKTEIPYLDLIFVDFNITRGFFNSPYLPPIYNRKKWYKNLKKYTPIIDGGLFLCDTDLLKKYPLDVNASWGESEDLYWCTNILNNARVVEIDTNCKAHSKTYKLSKFYINFHFIYPIYSKFSFNLRKVLLLFYRIFR